jgi:hypothetical protein
MAFSPRLILLTWVFATRSFLAAIERGPMLLPRYVKYTVIVLNL